MNGPRPNSIGAPIVQANGSRRSSGRSASLTASSMSSATDSVTCGRLLGDVELARLRTPASVRSSQRRRTAASVSASKSSSTECTMSARQALHPVRVERHRAHRLELGRPETHPRLQATRHAAVPSPTAPRGCRSRRRREPAATHRSPGRRAEHVCEASASSVNAAWFNVPKPALTTISTGAPRSTARSRRVTPPSPISTSNPPAPSTRVSRPGRSTAATIEANSPRVGNRTPARCAAAAGASGSGSRARPCNSVTPDSRPISARSSSPSADPVCTGLHTATSIPANRAWHASAAVATVLPTPVSVPVTTRTLKPSTALP